MMKDDTVYLNHILGATKRVEEYMAGVTRQSFLTNHLLQDAVVRQIEIIGEAARNVSTKFQEAHTDLPWHNMVGMRNKIIHDYFDVDFEVVWDTANDDLPSLRRALESILGTS